MLKWLAMTLSPVVITFFIYKPIWCDFCVFLLLLIIALTASYTSFLFSSKKILKYLSLYEWDVVRQWFL